MTASTRPVGLLTLQGDYGKHRQAFAALGRVTRDVRRPAELDEVSCLVIPGGESTTLTRLIDRGGLREPLRAFAAERPVMGTCAGLIMLAGRLEGERRGDFGVEPLGLLDCTVRRNAYGRQIDSFTAPVGLGALDGSADPFAAVFIRAPRITAIGRDAEVVISHAGEAVAVRQGRLLGLTFHPELTADLRIHRAFLDLVR
ncbi:MAG: pyridoxal 5'-phosphate synthase glutaminase subunit PdxT [Krumholzibacteria bacterium]|nr:pyridoxal 5'-phosphate synthase glutaminase subunit PdxT [Candidatus Krumholzibacteria bacterium]